MSAMQNLLIPSIGNAFDGSPFEPTEGKQYEAGIKYQPTGAEHLITMAAFDLTQENVITADPVNPGFQHSNRRGASTWH